MNPIATPLRTALYAGFFLTLLVTPGCVFGLFSGINRPDRSRPVVRIETRGGIEYGATTSLGILTLGRTATEGPCRVHYFLGEQMLVEDGHIEHFGGVYYEARMDLKHQHVEPWLQPVQPSDRLIAIALDGNEAVRVPLTLARGDDLAGDLLEDPGRPLYAGTGVFVEDPDTEQLSFVGLIAGAGTLRSPLGDRRFLVYTGLERLREAMLIPEPIESPTHIRYRPDGIWIREKSPLEELPEREPLPGDDEEPPLGE